MIPTIVLTAGLGTRLRPLTGLLAKPAVPVAGRPLVVRVLTWLRDAGFGDVVANLHHLPHTVTAAVGDGAHLGLRVRYSWEPVVLGSAGGPARALRLWPGYDGPVLVVNGDTLTALDLAAVMAAHHANRAEGALVTMAAVPNRRPDHYNGLRLDAGHTVIDVIPRGHREATWHFVGVQVVEASLLRRVSGDEPSETVSGLYRDLMGLESRSIRVHPLEASFLDVGTPADYLEASFALERADGGARQTIVESSGLPGAVAATVAPNADLRHCVVWPGAVVGPGAVLESSVVLTGAVVPPGTVAREVVWTAAGPVPLT